MSTPRFILSVLLSPMVLSLPLMALWLSDSRLLGWLGTAGLIVLFFLGEFAASRNPSMFDRHGYDGWDIETDGW